MVKKVETVNVLYTPRAVAEEDGQRFKRGNITAGKGVTDLSDVDVLRQLPFCAMCQAAIDCSCTGMALFRDAGQLYGRAELLQDGFAPTSQGCTIAQTLRLHRVSPVTR